MLIIYYILFFILIIFILFIFLFFLNPLFSLIPFVPVKNKIIDEIIKVLELKENSVLYDLGCGDGRILFKIAKKNKNILCIGIEIAPFPFILAKIKKFLNTSQNVHILYGNFLNLNISSASHIFLYLFPEALDNLLPKFEKELKPGSKIISYNFEFSQRKPSQVIKIKSTKQNNNKLFIYNF